MLCICEKHYSSFIFDLLEEKHFRWAYSAETAQLVFMRALFLIWVSFAQNSVSIQSM